mmetsp:Transcript_30272/g.77155  ORF Transcript_30272/g.77155 Transcript_30272/m.77155 type:complete len:276 (-) Transcript_30272:274-1101(-)
MPTRRRRRGGRACRRSFRRRPPGPSRLAARAPSTRVRRSSARAGRRRCPCPSCRNRSETTRTLASTLCHRSPHTRPSAAPRAIARAQAGCPPPPRGCVPASTPPCTTRVHPRTARGLPTSPTRRTRAAAQRPTARRPGRSCPIGRRSSTQRRPTWRAWARVRSSRCLRSKSSAPCPSSTRHSTPRSPPTRKRWPSRPSSTTGARAPLRRPSSRARYTSASTRSTRSRSSARPTGSSWSSAGRRATRPSSRRRPSTAGEEGGARCTRAAAPGYGVR